MSFFNRSPNIANLKSKHDLSGLIDALGYQKNMTIRIEAVTALGDLGDEQAVEALSTALRESVSSLIFSRDFLKVAPFRSAVVTALGKIGNSRAKQILLETLGDESEPVYEAAAHVLIPLINHEDIKEYLRRLRKKTFKHELDLSSFQKRVTNILMTWRPLFSEMFMDEVIYNLMMLSASNQNHIKTLDAVTPGWKKSKAAEQVIPLLVAIIYGWGRLSDAVKQEGWSFDFKSPERALDLLEILIASGHGQEALAEKVKDFGMYLGHPDLRKRALRFLKLSGSSVVGAVGIVIELTQESSWYAKDYIALLETILADYAQYVEVADLQTLVQLDSARLIVSSKEDIDGEEITATKPISSAKIQKLAKQEFVRRGLS